MDAYLKTGVWEQLGAAIDTLDEAIKLCPARLWTAALWDDSNDARYGQFWFLAYHPIFWLDLFLTGSSEGFKPPAPFLRGKLPKEPYSKDALLAYLADCRMKARAAIEALTDEKAAQRCRFEWMEVSYLELQLYNMRHIQEHAAELDLLLGQNGIKGMDWVAVARDERRDT